jgi:regulator of replication initiation timing
MIERMDYQPQLKILCEVVARQAAKIATLETEKAALLKHVAELKAENEQLREQVGEMQRAASKAESAKRVFTKPSRPKRPEGQPRKKRAINHARKREKATRYVDHYVDRCRGCGCALRGGSVKRSRQVLHIPLLPVEVIEHRFYERRCPLCGRREVPGAEVLQGEVIGKHRVSVQTMAIIATLREVGRLPDATVQWILETFFGLRLSGGEIVAILHDVADQAQGLVADIEQRLRNSPVVHADETVWRENGQNGYFWFSGNPVCCRLWYRPSRSGDVILEMLGEDFAGTLVSDFYSAYGRLLGQHQRCWIHLLRAIHDLKLKYPDNVLIENWAQTVHAIFLDAVQHAERLRDAPPAQRTQAQRQYEQRLMACCQPHLEQAAPQTVLCKRVQRFLPELFVFVADPRVPPDNNAAERGVRPMAVSRKISGGTRSSRGSATKGTLSSIYGTWRLQSRNPFSACLDLLHSPQV